MSIYVRKQTAIVLALVLGTGVVVSAHAQESQNDADQRGYYGMGPGMGGYGGGYGMGPGMMGGYGGGGMGPGMMGGYGGGYGTGPGMMGPGMGGYDGGYGMGPGMMGGYGGGGMGPGMMGGYGGGYGMGSGMMGPGMMGGYGGGYGMGSGMMGPGMMGGYGGGYGMGPGMMGPGMMGGYGGCSGYGTGQGMNLSETQRTKLRDLNDQLRKEHWNVMGKMMDVYNKLRDAYATEKPDPNEIGTLYSQVSQLRQQMIEAHVQAHNQIMDLLTDEQRQQIQHCGRGGPAGSAGDQSSGPKSGGKGNGSMMQSQ